MFQMRDFPDVRGKFKLRVVNQIKSRKNRQNWAQFDPKDLKVAKWMDFYIPYGLAVKLRN